MDENQLAAYFWYIPLVGACLFGTVVGWLAHNVFQRAELLNVSWLASMIGVIGGGAVTAIFKPNSLMFGAYCIGLGFAFFVRVFIHPISKAIAEEMELEKLKETKRRERAEAKKQEALENKGSAKIQNASKQANARDREQPPQPQVNSDDPSRF